MWEYFTANCYFKENCEQCKDERGKKVSHWVLDIYDGEHHRLTAGLNAMGKQGWELVAVQQTAESGMITYHQPSHFYVFKRQITA